ncbi:hypothetical protein EIN_217360 [Entamoeba invadens IP1]|uniref:Thioredoxin domain-containing protein n=2 Tax=Entamoeba invadens TaxID=33085 RepID=L7FPD4_ENTIV|nr:hypothetical protein EIN_294160 [Entamoeba invadens IP1]XP_004262092.1 hypothetical protein EIN_217360 [Entamoeba invadens IP1]BAN40264.1 hypothetical protein, conserved [Entamoeba invadens]ELP90966.1 hypothetical protein EIN_294160 [Entamoeba invadens IP1]ELP95321.1 hypothetical protein EIN_217360 [Entamoeba invadens IP1]BAN40282.1 hypothetical protein, conserved [Entamoeba invadens]BAN40622.1 hypothetical protein, conserved [Entamoeba invadens]|eukprot:XP_004257737.1 hypothetical protein EIN_294160 [Entamoeba invadens IP1]
MSTCQKECCAKKESCCEKVCPAKKAYEEFLRAVPKAQVGEEAPTFKAQALCPCNGIVDFDFEKVRGKFVVLLFYPLDWTFVCPTEMLGYSKLAEEMKDVQFIGISVDSVFCHKAWCDAPREHGGIGKLAFPLVSDIKKCISMKYNMFNAADGIARRGYVVIDPKGIIRYMQVNDNGIGRNTEETKRIIEAIKFSDEHGEVCPLNWKPGKDTMKPSPEGVADYLVKH